MNDILSKLLEAVEYGKVNQESPYPPNLKGMNGAHELTQQALDSGIMPQEILETALIPAMGNVGRKFSENKIFVPQMLMSARAMGASMAHLKPFFASGKIRARGTFVIGTVKGDLHDIGKNLVAMMVEGAGWTIVDLGVDVDAESFLEALVKKPRCRGRAFCIAHHHHDKHGRDRGKDKGKHSRYRYSGRWSTGQHRFLQENRRGLLFTRSPRCGRISETTGFLIHCPPG
jgi:hypothetical protein